MRVVIQRVSSASVVVDDAVVGSIAAGLLVLVGVVAGDTDADADLVADKIAHLRIMADEEGKMNRSVIDVGGSILLVSQFTLAADARKGRRPSFTAAADPAIAEPLISVIVDRLGELGVPVATGAFGAMMDVHLVNDGPVTIVFETRD